MEPSSSQRCAQHNLQLPGIKLNVHETFQDVNTKQTNQQHHLKHTGTSSFRAELISWNVGHHKGSQVLKPLMACITSNFGHKSPVVLMLQEVASWHDLSGTILQDKFAVLVEKDCDCGMLNPAEWSSHIRFFHTGPYLMICVIGDIIYMCSHLLDHWIPGGRAEQVIFEAVHHCNMVRFRFPGICFGRSSVLILMFGSVRSIIRRFRSSWSLRSSW